MAQIPSIRNFTGLVMKIVPMVSAWCLAFSPVKISSLAQIVLPEISVLIFLNGFDNVIKQYIMSTTLTVFYKQSNRQAELKNLTKEMLLIDGKIRM